MLLLVTPCALSTRLHAQRVTGHVVESSGGAGVALAQVSLVDSAGSIIRSTTSDTAGFFVLDARVGRYRLSVLRFGYAPYSSEFLALRRDETASVTIRLVPHGVPLPAIEVHARGTERGRDAFERRRGLGKGVFLTVDSIRARNAIVASDAFYTVPGIEVFEGVYNNTPKIYSIRGAKCLVIFIDSFLPPFPIKNFAPTVADLRNGIWRDARTGERPLDQHPPLNEVVGVDWIQGIEIYRDMSEIPKELRTAERMKDVWKSSARSPEACGMAIVWTRSSW